MRRNNLHPFQKLISMLLVMAVLLSFVVLPANAAEEDNKYYFFDSSIVNKKENVKLEVAKVSKATTNESWVDQYGWTVDSDIPEWERRVTIMYPHVEYSGGTYKMWYQSLYPADACAWEGQLIDKPNTNNVELGGFSNTAKGTIYEGKDLLCYMESTDGINWTRPDLGEFYYKKQDGTIVGTNIVFVGSHGLGVNKNENPDSSEPKYLMAGRAYESDYYPGNDPTDKVGVTISWSDDGIHWAAPVTIKTGDEHSANITYVRADSHNQLFWSTERDCYAVITRSYTGSLRQVAYLEAKENLNSIRDMATVKANGGEEYWEATSPYWTTPDHALDFNVTTGAQPYSMPIAHVEDGYYIGVVSMLDWNGANGVQYQVHAELTWSPDGKTWYYMDKGTPVIANATTFALERGNDYGMIYCAAPVEVGNQVKIYYAAVPELHYTAYNQIPSNIKSIVDAEIPSAAGKGVTRTTTLSVATFGKDRYAGYTSENGTVTTKWFEVAGNLKLTADVESGGSLKVAVVGDTGEVIEGYDFDNCTAVTSDITDGTITWGDKNLSELNGHKVSFRIQLNNASVYTISGGIETTEAPELPEEPFSWVEDFEDGLSEWMVRDVTSNGWEDKAPYTNISLTAKAYESSQGFGLQNSGKKVLIRKNFDEQMNKVLSIMFYDDLSSTETRVMACMEVDANNRLALGVYSTKSTENYTLWPQTVKGENPQYQDTGVARSNGWHQFTWDARSGTGIDVYIDGNKILSDTTRTSFSQITLGWWNEAVGTTNAFDNVVIGDELPWEAEVDDDQNQDQNQSIYTASLNCADTDLNVGQQMTVYVVVNGTEGEKFASGEVEATYDSTRLTFNKDASELGSATIPEQVNGTIKLADYGADKNFGNAYKLVFDTVKEGNAEVKLTSAKFSTYANAASDDLVEANLSNATVTAKLTQFYSVTLPDGFTGNTTVKKDDNYTFTADDTLNFTYEVTATMGGKSVDVIKNTDGSYTINNVTGVLDIDAEFIPNSYAVTFVGNGAEDVEVKPESATYGQAFTFTMPSKTGFAYSVAITYKGTENTITYSTDDDGVVTIAGDKITGAITINVTRTQTDANMSVSGSGAGDVELPPQATPGTNLVFTVNKDIRYNYEVTATVNGKSVKLTPGENGQYTLDGDDFNVGDNIVISIVKTVKAENVAVSEYVTVDQSQMWLITFTTTKMTDNTYTYNGNKMYWSEKYGAYCYLVVAKEKPTVTADDLAIVTGVATEVNYGMDVNMTNVVDANDAQLVYNMYKPYYANFTDDVTMEKFLRADVNCDGKIDMSDPQAIIASLLS